MKISKLIEKLSEYDKEKEVRLVVFAESDKGDLHYFVSSKNITLKQDTDIMDEDEDIVSIFADAEGHFIG